MDELRELSCVDDIRDLLGKLPEDLKLAYDKIMERVKERKGRPPGIAYRAFLWVMHSSRPLGKFELVEAVCQDPATEATDPINASITAEFILDACNNLLMIDQSNFWRFSHLSVQEYLETHHYGRAEADTLIGTVCLRLLSDPTNNAAIRRLGDQSRGDLLSYAVLFWTIHVRRHASPKINGCLQNLLKQFFGSANAQSPAYVAWCSAHKSLSYKRLPLGIEERAVISILYFGLTGVLDGWWSSELDVISTTNDGYPLLHAAIQGSDGGNLGVVRKLLELGHGANSYGSALMTAAQSGHEAVVRLLLDTGADANAQGRWWYANALQAAAGQSNNEATVRILLDRGADVNAQGGFYGNALQAAAGESNNEATVCILLDRGADVNAQGGKYCNALQAAAGQSNNEATVRILLDRGADVNAQGGTHGNALQASAGQSNNEATVRILLDRGADVNAQGGKYGNALQAAALQRDNEATVRILLDRGADVNAQGGPDGNALQAAARGGNEPVIRILLSSGASFNSLDEEYHARYLRFVT